MRTTLHAVAVVLVMAGGAAPALAGQARPRSAPPPPASTPPAWPGGEAGRESSRPQAQRRDAPPPPVSLPQQERRQDDRGRQDARTDDRNGARYDGRLDHRSESRSAPSRQAMPAPRDRDIDLNRNGRDGDRGPRIVIAPRQIVRFSRPWYTFLPQRRVSIGITIGRPIAFPSWYDPYIVGRPGGPMSYMAYGGVSFDVEPRDADLWIDGEYVGQVSDYSPYGAPLVLVAGRHVVDVRGRYCSPLSFEITVVPGQVIPYSGTLPYYR